MEPKKIKKLVLKKETISSLSNHDQNNVRGGTLFPSVLCTVALSIALSCHGTCDYGGNYPSVYPNVC